MSSSIASSSSFIIDIRGFVETFRYSRGIVDDASKSPELLGLSPALLGLSPDVGKYI